MPPTAYLWGPGLRGLPWNSCSLWLHALPWEQGVTLWPRQWAHRHGVGPLGGGSLGSAFQTWAAPMMSEGWDMGNGVGVTAAITVSLFLLRIINHSPGCRPRSPCTSGEIHSFHQTQLTPETVRSQPQVDLDLDPGSIMSCESIITFSEPYFFSIKWRK